nr:hypothetical protein [Endozoicomonas sp.]
MIATIIGTLYGGSSLGTSAILDRAETRLFNREIKTVESDDDDEATTCKLTEIVDGEDDPDLTDPKSRPYLKFTNV